MKAVTWKPLRSVKKFSPDEMLEEILIDISLLFCPSDVRSIWFSTYNEGGKKIQGLIFT